MEGEAMEGKEHGFGAIGFEERTLMRIFIGENDHYHGRSLAEAIVLKARELGLAGATVLRGILGFGADSKLHSVRLLALAEDLPLVIELVDTEEKLRRLVPFLDEAVPEGMVTVESVRCKAYRSRKDT